jgi:predicted enzyme related to lactoylglutathione lyase
MTNNIKLLVYPVKDMAKEKAFFNKFLGVAPYVDSPYYTGYKVRDLEVGLAPNSSAGPIAYIDVKDIKAAVKEIVAAGGVIINDARDVAQGLLVAEVKDPNGSTVGFRQQT